MKTKGDQHNIFRNLTKNSLIVIIPNKAPIARQFSSQSFSNKPKVAILTVFQHRISSKRLGFKGGPRAKYQRLFISLTDYAKNVANLIAHNRQLALRIL